jgi:MFS family permease
MDKKWWTLLAVCAGTFMLLLDVTIVTVAQPAIQSGLHASFSDVQWVLDAYALTLAYWPTGTAGSCCSRPAWSSSRSARCCADWPPIR